jgi:hypothetical protein
MLDRSALPALGVQSMVSGAIHSEVLDADQGRTRARLTSRGGS